MVSSHWVHSLASFIKPIKSSHARQPVQTHGSYDAFIIGFCLFLLIFVLLAFPYPYSPPVTWTLCILYLAVILSAYQYCMQTFAVKMQTNTILNASAYYRVCKKWMQPYHWDLLPCSVLSVDLGDFRLFNAIQGHVAADAALMAVEETLQKNVCALDIIDRLNGERFSVFLPNTDLLDALKIAKNIHQAIEGCNSLFETEGVIVTARIDVTPEMQTYS